jgi:hypothetical protein
MRGWAALGLCLGLAAAGQAQIQSFTVTPGALSFTAIDPDTGGPAPQSSTLEVRFRGFPTRYWTLHVQADSAALENCGAIPASAVQVRCESASFSGSGPGNAACNSAAIPLSATPQLLVQGRQGNQANTITVNLRVAFADQWQYPAALAPACTISLRYTVDIP